jgi:Holliday junction resolvase
MSESAIQTGILKYLKSLPNTWAVKIVTSNKNGTPDILACVEGQFVALEVKTASGSTSPIQDFQISQITGAGGTAAVVRSVDDVKKVLALVL